MTKDLTIEAVVRRQVETIISKSFMPMVMVEMETFIDTLSGKIKFGVQYETATGYKICAEPTVLDLKRAQGFLISGLTELIILHRDVVQKK